jgi:hypothetical protein
MKEMDYGSMQIVFPSLFQMLELKTRLNKILPGITILLAISRIFGSDL